MPVTCFIDLPELILLEILHYLSSFDAIHAFYDIDRHTDRLVNLLIEKNCFSNIHQLRLPLFEFVCDDVLPRLGENLFHLTLYDHQLSLAHRKRILLHLPNLSSLHLLNLTEHDNDLSYFLHEQIEDLTIEFISEHHIEAQAYVCEQFIFEKCSRNLQNCQLINRYGLQLKHLNLHPNSSLQQLTIQLKELTDLHILFDHLVNIRVLNVQICRWTMEEMKYDYKNLSTKFPHFIEFSFQSEHAVSYNQMLKIIENLHYLEKLSFIYRNYDERGIDIPQLVSTITNLPHLIHLNFLIKFIYFTLNPKLTFEETSSFNNQWNIHTYINPLCKSYLAYTRPFQQRDYSISTDMFFEDEDLDFFPSVINLNVTTHVKQLSFFPIVDQLNRQFPFVTHLHVADSFGVLDDEQWIYKLPRITSFNGSEIKIWNLLENLLQSMPNLSHLQIDTNILLNSNLKIFRRKSIKSLELIANNFDEINEYLLYFPRLEHLIINTKKHFQPFERKFFRSLLHWFDLSSRLSIIHIHAHKLSQLFYPTPIESNEHLHFQSSNELLTLWK